jgi:hypothetical protein
MAAVRGFSVVLLLCMLVISVAVTADERADGSVGRERGHSRAPHGKRRQQVRIQGDHIKALVQAFHNAHLQNTYSI